MFIEKGEKMDSKEKVPLDCLKGLNEEQFKALAKKLKDGPSPLEQIEKEKARRKEKIATEAEKKVGFKCPICGYVKYGERYSRTGPVMLGGHTPTKLDGYYCKGCSAHFGSPTQFTNAGKKKRATKKRRKT